MEPLARNVDKIHAWCAERGAAFVLVALPRSYQHSAREAPNNWEAREYTVLGPYALELADLGWEAACAADPALAKGLNVVRGRVVHPAVAAAHGITARSGAS